MSCARGITSSWPPDNEALLMLRILPFALGIFFAGALSLRAQSPTETSPLPSPSIPAGPRSTATVTPLQATPQPTNTVTPLPSGSLAGTQPRTTNTVAPSPSPGP